MINWFPELAEAGSSIYRLSTTPNKISHSNGYLFITLQPAVSNGSTKHLICSQLMELEMFTAFFLTWIAQTQRDLCDQHSTSEKIQFGAKNNANNPFFIYTVGSLRKLILQN